MVISGLIGHVYFLRDPNSRQLIYSYSPHPNNTGPSQPRADSLRISSSLPIRPSSYPGNTWIYPHYPRGKLLLDTVILSLFNSVAEGVAHRRVRIWTQAPALWIEPFPHLQISEIV